MKKPTRGQNRVVERAWEEREAADKVDTERPGVSATDQKSDSNASTARRNLKGEADRATAALESAEPGERPSRKSTRGSANRAKGAAELSKAATRAVTSPQARAARNKTRR